MGHQYPWLMINIYHSQSYWESITKIY
jgi:hypothetical protein